MISQNNTYIYINMEIITSNVTKKVKVIFTTGYGKMLRYKKC